MMRKLVTLIAIIFCVGYLYADDSEPTISTLDGEQKVCIKGNKHTLKVKINLPTGYDLNKVDSFVILWGYPRYDDKQNGGGMIIRPSAFGTINNLSLDFEFPGIYSDCQPEKKGEVYIETYRDGDDKNNMFLPTFRVPPTARIADDSLVTCVGQPFTFDGSKSCPTNITEYEWTIEGKKYYGQTYTHTFSTAGKKTISLKVTNQCGTDTKAIEITVKSLPEAVAEANAKIVANKYVICLNDNDKGKILLDGSKSKNANSYEWTSTSGNVSFSDYTNILDPDRNKKKWAHFTSTGIYNIVLKVDSDCNKPDYDTVKVEVIDRIPVYLNPISDTCGPIMYSPPSNVSGTEYFINNVKTMSFPKELKAGTYKIEAKYQNDCGPSKAEIEFKVFEPVTAKITKPSNGTVVCRDNNGKIDLEGNHSGGVFSGTNVQKSGNNYHFVPSQTGIFTIRFTTGSGQCLRSDSIKIEVIDNTPFILDEQPDVCQSLSYKPSPFFSDAEYKINGTIVNSFPKQLSPGNYKVEGVLSNACGDDQKVVDEFEVTTPQNVTINIPSEDITLCLGEDPIELKGSNNKGVFSTTYSGLITNQGSKWLFNPSQVGTHNVIFEEGVGQCKTSASVNIKVIERQVLTLNKQADVCTSLNYSIKPNNISGAKYTINGEPINGSKNLTKGKYFVVGTYEDACGIQEVRDTFEVKDIHQIKINSPQTGDVLCLDQGEIEIKVSDFGGTFTPNQNISIKDNKYYFKPTQKNDYTIKYTYGEGQGCSTSDEIKIKVIDENPLSLNKQADVCEKISYKPQPFLDFATYRINGQIYTADKFPVQLNEAKQYIVEAEFENACGKSIKRDTFHVTVPQDVHFIDYTNDITFCKADGRKEIKVSVPGGKFNNPQGFIEENGKYYFDPNISGIGNFTLTYEQGIGDCSRKAELKITVIESIPLGLPKQEDVCNSFEYTPKDFSPDATYRLNGKEISNDDFPYTISEAGQYIIEAEMTNECGTLILSDTFELFIPMDVKITHPEKDLTLCISEEKLKITGSTERGNFVLFDELTIVKSDEVELDISKPGVFKVVFEQGFGECYTSDTVTVTVEDAKLLELNHQYNACETIEYRPEPFLPEAEYKINGKVESNFPIVLNKGKYEIVATLVDACTTHVKEDSFEVYPKDSLKIIMDKDNKVCVNSDAILLASTIPGAVFEGEHLRYEDEQLFFDPIESGLFSIKLELTLANCIQEDIISIEVIGLAPKIEDVDVCQEITEIVLNGEPEGGVWSSTTCNDCIQGNIFIFNGIDTVYHYTYTLTNDIGCVAEDHAVINIISPTSDFELSTAPCSSGIDFDLSRSVGDEYIWLIDGIAVGLQPPFVGLETGEHKITMIAHLGDCFDTSSISVFIIDPVENAADFSLTDKEHCTPYTLIPNIHTPFYDYLDYKWTVYFDNDSIIYDTYDIAGGVELINNDPYRKLAIVKYEAGNICGMVKVKDSMEIIGIPQSVIGIDSSRYGCSPYTIAISNIARGEIESCIWRINGKVVSTSCNPYFYHTFTAKDSTTKHYIEFETSNECGQDIAFDTITVMPPGIDVFFNTDIFKVCQHSSVIFEDATTPNPIYWRWDFGDGYFSDEQNPTHTYRESGEFEIKLIASTGCGYDSIARPITVKPAPYTDFILPVYSCQNQLTDTIKNLSDYRRNKFVWDFGNGVYDSTHAHPRLVYDEFGNFDITLKVIDESSRCENSTKKSLEVKPKPQIDILLDSIICYGKELKIPNNTLYANGYTWYYDTIPVHQGKDPLIVIDKTGEHYIKLIADFNEKCIDSITKVVVVKRCDVYIPNLFTPNNDGKDDFFTAYGGVNTSLIRSMKIFDRWGEMVFSKNNFPLNVEYYGWDGSIKTRSKTHGLNSAVFVYIIEIEFADGTTERFTGDVTLLR